MADLALIGAVRVHDPNLPVAGAIGYEIDFGAEQRCAAHLRYNVGREFVGRFLRSGLVRRAEVTLAEDLGLRNRGLPHVEQPAVEHQYVVLHGGIAKRQVVGGDRRRGPVREPCASTAAWLLAGARAARGNPKAAAAPAAGTWFWGPF